MASTSIPALQQKDHAKYIRRKNTDGFRLKYSLSHTERKQLIREAGIAPLVLFEYYLRLASTENAILSDKDAAAYFEWSPHTAKRHRLALVNAGWLAVEKATLGNGRRVHVYYLGKDEVRESNLLPSTTPDEAKKQSLFAVDSIS